jgi:hypothetical protein
LASSDTLAPSLPFEVVVRGVAISLQGSADSKQRWKETIQAAARAALPEGAWLLESDPLAVTIYIFPAGKMRGDLDNRIKPILDALVGCAYRDDELIERIVAQKFEPGRYFAFPSPTDILMTALESSLPIVYMKLSGNVHEELS